MSETPTEQPQEPQAPAQEPAEAPAEQPEPVEQPAEGDEEPAPVEQPDEAAPPPAEPQAHATTEADWEDRFKKAGQRFATYERALYVIFEEDAHDLIRCPLCLDVPGFVDKNAAGRVPDEQADLVKHFLGLARPVELQQLPGYTTCGACAGEGKGYTGSKNPEHATVQCSACQGRGYLAPQAAATNGHVEPEPGVTGPTVYGHDLELGDKDEWEQPRLLPDGRDNPNYGRTPKYWIQVEPWGDTRNLTAQDAVTA